MISTLKNNRIEVCAKTHGAELTNLKSTASGLEYLWQADPAFWGKHAPILFPIVGKVANDRYRIGDRIFSLGQHGFARDSEFTLVEESSERLIYQLTSDENTLKRYPYQFELSVQYRLRSSKVLVRHTVKNVDSKTIWFSIGGHPAFNWPLQPNEKQTDYFLEFEVEESAVRYSLEDGLVSPKTEVLLDHEKILSLSPSLFESSAIILKDLKSRSATLRNKRSSHRITVEFAGFPYLGIWSKAGGAPFLCIEPWHGIADPQGAATEFRQKEGIRSLEPGEIFECEYGIIVE